MTNIEYLVVKGAETHPFIEAVAEIRIQVFQEWPYLYYGSFKGEKEYLSIYERSSDTTWLLARVDGNLIGVVTGIPLAACPDEIQHPFTENQKPLEGLYYLGEIVVLPFYRGKGIGLELYQHFEKEVRTINEITSIVHCSVVRDPNDIRKPLNYRSVDQFWKQQGYEILDEITAEFSYKEVDSEKKTPHTMVFQEKKL